MADEDQEPTGVDPFAGYEPSRPARMRGTGREPPPVPGASPVHGGFGAADEDGLRMLAALESLTSLEPDYSPDYFEDLTGEASVTIIEAAAPGAVDEAMGGEADISPLRDLLSAARADPEPGLLLNGPGLLLNGYETFLSAGEEAMVEIVEIDPSFDPPDRTTMPPATRATSLGERLAATEGPRGRFLKALFGD